MSCHRACLVARRRPVTLGAATALALLLGSCSASDGDPSGTASGIGAPAEPQAAEDSAGVPAGSADANDPGGDGTDEGGPGEAAPGTRTPEADLLADWPLSYAGPTVLSGQFEPGDYAGQDLVLWFWAPW